MPDKPTKRTRVARSPGGETHQAAEDVVLTTQQGVPVADDQNTLRAGERGAHGYFEMYEPLTELTRADLFQRAGERTPAFVRFSTVAGSLGSMDLARDVRGFAVKLYTHEGNWDIVGNNIPVFFIQDPIKFPDR